MSARKSAVPNGGSDRTMALHIRPARYPGRWIAMVLVTLLVAMFIDTLITNPRFEWAVVGRYFLADTILLGVRRTLELTAIAMAMGAGLGVLLAVMRLSPNPVLSGSSWAF